MIGSLIFTVLLFVTVLPYSLTIVIFRVVSRDAAFSVAVAWARLMCRLAELLCGLRFVVEGVENIPKTSSVVLFKHSSAFETIVQLLIFPRQTWVLKHELMWAPFLGWALAALQPIAIDRRGGHSAVEQVIEQGVERLRSGTWVMVFPEGTRVPAGETRRYGLSGTLLAQKAGVQLVPVAHDAGYFWPRRGLRKRAGIVRFCVGPPVDPTGRDPREVNDEIQRWIEKRIAELARPA